MPTLELSMTPLVWILAASRDDRVRLPVSVMATTRGGIHMSGFVIAFGIGLVGGWWIGRAEKKAKQADPIETLWGRVD